MDLRLLGDGQSYKSCKIQGKAHLQLCTSYTTRATKQMSGLRSCGLECVAYLIWRHNDDIFVGRLSVWFVNDFGDIFTHGKR